MLLLADNPRPRIFVGRSFIHGPAVWVAKIEWGSRIVCDPWRERYRHGLMVAIDLGAFRAAGHALRRVFFAGCK